MVTDQYRAYLLRMWRVDDDGGYWRARLENVETGEAQGFASLAKLIEFLQSLGEDGEPPGKQGGEGFKGA
jgi:hypothetical protein